MKQLAFNTLRLLSDVIAVYLLIVVTFTIVNISYNNLLEVTVLQALVLLVITVISIVTLIIINHAIKRNKEDSSIPS